LAARLWWARQLDRMEADLRTFILAEERDRLFGRTERIPYLVAEGVSYTWWTAYERTFTPPDAARPVQVDIQRIAIEGDTALVDLTLNGVPYVRAYRIWRGSWRRTEVPPEAWGEERRAKQLPNGVYVIYRPRDRTFADTLARDLPALFALLDAGTQTNALKQIEIEPHDLQPPLIFAGEQRIVLNSPLLLPPDGDGAERVRLALAHTLVARALPAAETDAPHDVLVRAAADVLAARWALDDDAYRDYIATWQHPFRKETSWRLALSAPFTPPLRSGVLVSPQMLDAAAHVAAAYLAEQDAPATLVRMLNASCTTWDTCLYTFYGRTLRELEAELLAFIEGRPATSRTMPAETLPRYAHVALYDSSLPAFVLQNEENGPPLIAELTPQTRITSGVGVDIPPTCIPTNALVEIEGEWFTEGRHLRAARITVREPLGGVWPPFGTAPANTVAFLARQEGNTTTLLALLEDGSETPLVQVERASVRFRQIPQRGDEAARFLFFTWLESCQRYWFLLFNAQTAEFHGWLSPRQQTPDIGVNYTHWRPDEADPLLVQGYPLARGFGTRYAVFTPTETPTISEFAPVAATLAPGEWPIGWSAATRRLVVYNTRTNTDIALIDLATGERRPFSLAQRIQIHALSPDGRYLAYGTRQQPRQDGPPTLLLVLDLTNGQTSFALPLPEGQWLASLAWSLRLEDPHLAFVVQEPRETFTLRVANVARPNATNFILTTDNIPLWNAVICPDGRLLAKLGVEENAPLLLHAQSINAQPLPIARLTPNTDIIGCPAVPPTYHLAPRPLDDALLLEGAESLWRLRLAPGTTRVRR
ncbi:hypothetical protein, partial [Ardenticatena maritima]